MLGGYGGDGPGLAQEEHDGPEVEPEEGDGDDGEEEDEEHALEGEGEEVPVVAAVGLAADGLEAQG